MGPRQLVQPDVRALGHEDDLGHPGRVGRERLRLVAESAEGRRLGPTAPAARPTTEAQHERALLLGEDPDGDVQPGDEGQERVAEERPPVLADIQQLAGQRGGRVPGRRPHDLEQRLATLGDGRPVREDGFEPGDRLAVARPAGQAAVVHELAQRPQRRVLVGDTREQQLLESVARRLRGRADAREFLPEPVEQADRVRP